MKRVYVCSWPMNWEALLLSVIRGHNIYKALLEDSSEYNICTFKF